MFEQEAWCDHSNENAITTSAGDLVYIAPLGIAIPMGRIILVRQNNGYGAIIFTEIWRSKTKEDLYKGKKIIAYSHCKSFYRTITKSEVGVENFFEQ